MKRGTKCITACCLKVELISATVARRNTRNGGESRAKERSHRTVTLTWPCQDFDDRPFYYFRLTGHILILRCYHPGAGRLPHFPFSHLIPHVLYPFSYLWLTMACPFLQFPSLLRPRMTLPSSRSLLLIPTLLLPPLRKMVIGHLFSVLLL